MTASPAPNEERKLATVVFADLVGSTALADSEDPERTRAMLNRFWDAMADEIVSAGGTVEKFAGDAVMAAFGAPTAYEDHAERALHATIAMQRRLGKVFNGQLTLRIGVNTGEVIVGRSRQGSSFVTGDVVNVAARLEQAAEPGEILVGERTVADARGAFEFEPPTAIAAKGKAQAVVAHRMLRAISLMRPRGVSGLAPAFVGRERELDHLMRLYAATVEARQPRLVTVLGDAGIGKTRLVRELWERIAAQTPEPLRRTGRCLPYGTAALYWAIGEVLKEHLGLLDTDPMEVVMQRLAGREILGLALGLDVGRDLHPLAARDRFQDAWASFLTELSSERPVALLIEDLHWAEPQLLELISSLLASVDGPLLVVATARQELLERSPGWGARGGEVIELEPLSPENSTRMLEVLVAGGLPESVRRIVVERAEGNPFFVEELLGMLIDRGILTEQDGAWNCLELPSDFLIPDTIHAVLAARIDLLGPVEKRALQAASVIGRIFWAGPVYELVEGEPDLRVIEARDLIRRRGISSMAGEREYAIKHALTREVAYASLTRAQRAEMHARVGAWLERTSNDRDEFAALLAHHYAASVRPEDADLAWVGREAEAARLRGRALQWLERAAGLAIRRCEIEDARTLLRQALTLDPDATTQARIWHAIGMTQALTFDGEAFLASMLRSLALDSTPSIRADTYSDLAFQAAIRSGMWRQRRLRELIGDFVARALESAEAGTPARARALIAQCIWERDAVEAAREAWELADQLGDSELRSYAMGAQADVALVSGDVDAGLAWSRRRLTMLGEISDPDHIADAYESAVFCFCGTLHLDEARSSALKHRAVVDRLSAHHRLHGIAVILEVEEHCGGWQRMYELSAEAEAVVDKNLATPCGRNAHSMLAIALAAAVVGDDQASRRFERRAEEVAAEWYGYALAPSRIWLALARGQTLGLDELVALLDVSRARSWNTFLVPAARLDALAALGERSLVEDAAAALLRPGTYPEPFALRALGVVRADDALIGRAAERFLAIGLDWHSRETRKLIAPG
jgi:class 3 adenylate cyclase